MKLPPLCRSIVSLVLVVNLLMPIGGLGLLPVALAADVTSDSASSQYQWPRSYKKGTTTLQVYQPAIEKWDGYTFQARSAVSVQTDGQSAPVFGVIWLTAQSDVDKSAGIVTLTNLTISKSSFPTAPDKADSYQAFIQKQVPAQPVQIPLSQIDNGLLLENAVQKTSTQPVKNDVPRIIFSTSPSLLVLVDGDPVMRPVNGTPYQRVFNTRALILQNTQGGPFYLRAVKFWFSSNSVAGPWAAEFNPPQDLAAAVSVATASGQVDLIDPPKDKPAPAVPPTVYVSMQPAEIVETNGQPQFVPIAETQLLEVKNSNNAIILDLNSQSYYVLISGRWFKSAKSMNGPWSFVAGKDVPPEFAKIPPDSDKGNVLVSVPGTPQAQEAAIATSIPQTATVVRSQAKVTVTYDGAPVFWQIDGTPLQYAINTPLPVIMVSPKSYYCVANGVWFMSPTATGPWVVATSVPPLIYSIPVASPLHYVTYVRVYGFTPDVVYVGYTPGYYGVVVAPDGTVVYGTGYVYPPYVGTTVYVQQPATYGYGAGFADGAVTGFAFGFVGGVVLGACLEPHWGCWGGGVNNGTVNVNVNNGNQYNHWGNNVVNHHNGNNPRPPFNPYNPPRNDNHGLNPNNGRYNNLVANTPNADNRQPQAKNPAVGGPGSTRQGTYPDAATRGTGFDNPARNNVYPGSDGNAYRQSNEGNWQRHTSSGWGDVDRSNFNSSELDRQSRGWDQGGQRFSNDNGGRHWGGGGGSRRR